MKALLASSAVALALPALAKEISYIGSVHTVPAETSADTATGRVFLDANRNSVPDAGEAGVEGVLVSNGLEVVVTDADGRWELPAYEDMNVFITKPAGYTNPVDEDLIPQVHYIHKEAGSPDLRFGGLEPTGPLPSEINFPLIEDPVGDKFSCFVFGDAQPYSNQEVSYVRQTVAAMLAERDTSDVECLIFEGDVMGDDLSLYPRFKEIVATGGVPQYFVGGNHDLDFDAPTDQHSFDTFRREFGPEYYSFDIGNVHFVVLDNVNYPCYDNPHPFCAADLDPTYNGIISGRQLEWLANDLANVPEDKLIVLNAHIPFVAYIDASAQKHQTDNLGDLYAIVGDRPALGLTGHTHTIENLLPGENYAGWEENTGTGAVPFHQIVTGAVSGSWWTGDVYENGVPMSLQRLGAPRGYVELAFDGSDYVDSYYAFGRDTSEQMHASVSHPRFRDWAETLMTMAEVYDAGAVVPPLNANDLGDPNMITAEEAGESWIAVNFWHGSRESTVTVTLDGQTLEGVRTQEGNGEEVRGGADFADPYALIRQLTETRRAAASASGENDGYQTWQGFQWSGEAGPTQPWMFADQSMHLWRVDLPADLAPGVHVARIEATDHHGRTHMHSFTFEVVEELPQMTWQASFFE